MSRYIIKKDDKQLAYGFDHVLGYFYDITDLNEPDDSKDHLIESKSYFINGIYTQEHGGLIICIIISNLELISFHRRKIF